MSAVEVVGKCPACGGLILKAGGIYVHSCKARKGGK